MGYTLGNSTEERFCDLVPLNEVIQDELPGSSMILKDILSTGLAGLVGRPTSGKTYLAILQALSICSGQQLGGITPLQQGSVLYFTTETSRNEIAARASAYLEKPDLPSNFFVSGNNGGSVEGWKSRLQRTLDRVGNVKIVVVDPVVFLFGGKIHQRYGDQYEVLQSIRQLAKERQIAILVTNHMGKGSAERTSSSYGSNAFSANFDILQTIDRDGKTLEVSGNSIPNQAYEIGWQGGLPFHLIRSFDPCLRNLRVTVEQEEVLEAVAGAPEGQAKAKDLAEKFSKDKTGAAVRQLLGHLKDKGLIQSKGKGWYAVTKLGGRYIGEILVTREQAQGMGSPAVSPQEIEINSNSCEVVVQTEEGSAQPAGTGLKEADEAPIPISGDIADGDLATPAPNEAEGTEAAAEAIIFQQIPSNASLPSPTPKGSTPDVHESAEEKRFRLEAERDRYGIRISEVNHESPNDADECLKARYKERYIASHIGRRASTSRLVFFTDPYSYASMVKDGNLERVLKDYSEEAVMNALDLYIELAERHLLIQVMLQKKQIQLRKVNAFGTASISRPEADPNASASRFSAAPEELHTRLSENEELLVSLMASKSWDEVFDFILSTYLSGFEAETVFSGLNGGGSSSCPHLEASMLSAEKVHRSLIFCGQQGSCERHIQLQLKPQNVAYPLRRRKIQESMGLPAWPT